MTVKFNNLVESLLSEMMPASMLDDFGPGEMTAAVNKKVEELPGKSQHWGPLQKLNATDRERIIRAIINNVFTDKGNTYTPMADDRNQLKELIKSAIVKATSQHPEFKAGGKWAVQFLADRMANEDLLGKVKYTTDGGEEIKKEATQKEMKAALDKALKDTKGQSVWKRSKKQEDPAPVEPEVAPNPVEEEPSKSNPTETVYIKAADLDSDDPELQKAFNKIPEDKELSYYQLIQLVKTKINGKMAGASLVDRLVQAGGLSEEEREKPVSDDQEVPDLDLEDDGDIDLSDPSRYISPHERTTRGSFDWDRMDNWE